jgi:hypothetical protein
LFGQAVTSRVITDPNDGQRSISFQPTPFGNDLRIGFGDEFALPIIGNFDPPATGSSGSSAVSFTNSREELDVNNDGYITALDALIVINELNTKGAMRLTGTGSGPFVDVDADGYMSPSDSLRVINWLNSHPGGVNHGETEGEGEGAAEAYFAALGSDDGWLFSDLESGAAARKRR